MSKNKFLSIMFLIALIVVSGVVSAAVSNDYRIRYVSVGGVSAEDDMIEIERGSTVKVKVEVEGTGNYTDNVKVRAEIGGYEYDSVYDISEPFVVENGIVKRFTLQLNIPDDIDPAGTYKLYVRIFDANNYVEEDYNVYVREQRNKLNVMDVILYPSDYVEAGKVLFGKVRVENIGYKKQEDIKVVMSIPELGLSTRDYIPELSAEDDVRADEEDSDSSDELFLKIPANTPSGIYNVKIEIDYNRGHDIEVKNIPIKIVGAQTVPGVEQPTVSGVQGIISVDTLNQNVVQGDAVVYRVMIANLGNQVLTYSLDVSNIQSWGTLRIDPAFLTVQPGSTGEMLVYIRANEDAVVGRHQVNANVKIGNTVIKSFTLDTDVVEGKTIASWQSVKSVLQILFIVLVVVLVILALVLVFNKLRGSNNENYNEEPIEHDSGVQSYY